jgi:transposase
MLMLSGRSGLETKGIATRAFPHAQWLELDRRIRAFDAEFAAFLRENADTRLLASIPGVGPFVASALIAAIGAGETFEHGRDLSAWLVNRR